MVTVLCVSHFTDEWCRFFFFFSFLMCWSRYLYLTCWFFVLSCDRACESQVVSLSRKCAKWWSSRQRFIENRMAWGEIEAPWNVTEIDRYFHGLCWQNAELKIKNTRIATTKLHSIKSVPNSLPSISTNVNFFLIQKIKKPRQNMSNVIAVSNQSVSLFVIRETSKKAMNEKYGYHFQALATAYLASAEFSFFLASRKPITRFASNEDTADVRLICVRQRSSNNLHTLFVLNLNCRRRNRSQVAKLVFLSNHWTNNKWNKQWKICSAICESIDEKTEKKCFAYSVMIIVTSVCGELVCEWREWGIYTSHRASIDCIWQSKSNEFHNIRQIRTTHGIESIPLPIRIPHREAEARRMNTSTRRFRAIDAN